MWDKEDRYENPIWGELERMCGPAPECTCPDLPAWRREGVSRATERMRAATWLLWCRCGCPCHRSHGRYPLKRQSRWEQVNAPRH